MVEQETRQATVTTPSEREIRIEREFDAPRERVFAVYTDPELIPQWWGPRRYTTEVDYMEPRTGGRWRFVHRGEDGSEIGFQGAYREVTAPERIVQTFEWEGMAGHVSVETGHVRGHRRRPHQGHHGLGLPHHRGARRHARLGHGGRHERDLRAAGRAAGQAELRGPLTFWRAAMDGRLASDRRSI